MGPLKPNIPGPSLLKKILSGKFEWEENISSPPIKEGKNSLTNLSKEGGRIKLIQKP